jgi:N-methylhydantoinase B
VPVFHDGEVVAFVQAFGHHDDIGGAVPGSMPSNGATVFEEGLSVPADQAVGCRRAQPRLRCGS